SASSGTKIHMALAPGTKSHSYKLKTSSPKTRRLLGFIQSDRQVLGDDPRVRQARGKPAPDIFLVALRTLNPAADSGESPISHKECLVFENSIIRIEAARRAGMRVVWVPHPDIAVEYQARQEDVLAGRTRLVDIRDKWQLGYIDN
ncbi:putative HAD superfamily hydrolase, partial [Aspergillus vadensis CBS 113365]